jgi:alkylated DNA repair dioxygenase AlkB
MGMPEPQIKAVPGIGAGGSHIGWMRKHHTAPEQSDMFGAAPQPGPPPGFRYAPDFVSESEQDALVAFLAALPLAPFEFRGFQGNRRVAAFGFRYDYGRRALEPASPLPAELLDLRNRAARWAGAEPSRFCQILVNEYRPGAPIGWHLDKPQFDQVLGVSLLAPANLRLRRSRGNGWERRSVPVAPRSLYLLSGEVRREWQHSIAPLTELRYSITLRSLTAEFAARHGAA